MSILLKRSFWQNLAELGRIYLSSVLPRHFYCNWASPVTTTATTLGLVDNTNIASTDLSVVIIK